MIRTLAVLPVLLALAACGKETAEAPADDRRGAEGEVLGGTISDAMLPLPTVRSQSPPLEAAPASSGSEEAPTESPQPGPSAAEPQPAADIEAPAEAAPEEVEN